MPAIAGIFRFRPKESKMLWQRDDRSAKLRRNVNRTSSLLKFPGEIMDQDSKKLIAAKAALNYIQSGTILGVGTGSTVNQLIELLPGVREKIETVVSSSTASTALLEKRGFDVSRLNAVGDLDLYIDGGPSRGIVPSTVLKVADDLFVLRHGLISEAEINRFMSLGE